MAYIRKLKTSDFSFGVFICAEGENNSDHYVGYLYGAVWFVGYVRAGSDVFHDVHVMEGDGFRHYMEAVACRHARFGKWEK